MEIFTLLEALEDILERSKTVPFTEKSIIEKDQFLDIIKEIRLKLPDELKQAKWIKEERERIIAEAQKDADDIVKEAENRIISMIDEHEITKKAYQKKEEIVAEANEMYRNMVRDTNVYADDFYIEQVVTNYFTNAMKNATEINGQKKIYLMDAISFKKLI